MRVERRWLVYEHKKKGREERGGNIFQQLSPLTIAIFVMYVVAWGLYVISFSS